MALRTKTIEYTFLTNSGTLNPGTTYVFPSQTLWIPENSSRTFRSVYSQVSVRGAAAAAANLTSWNIGIGLTTASINNTLSTVTVTNSGEHESFMFLTDHTSYFNTNFGNGTSQACGMNFAMGTLSGTNVTAKLFITYEYQDTGQTTRVKTVKIPIESTLGQLTNALAELSGGVGLQVPNMDTFCPEQSKVMRQMWFELIGNEASNATTNFNVGVRLDSLTEQSRATLVQNLQSSCWYYDIWDVTNTLVTSSAHAFTARTSVTARMSNFGAILHATYEYDHSASTSSLNSVILPFCDEQGFGNSTAAISGNLYIAPINIQEPGPILLRQSGLVSYFNARATNTISMSFGTQAGRAYVSTQGTLTCGQNSFVHRLDTSSGITLTRGMNYLTATWFNNTANIMTSFDGMIILNYTSSISDAGDGAHNHTTYWLIRPTLQGVAINTSLITSQSFFNIAETNYYINGVTFNMPMWTLLPAAAATAAGFNLECENVAGEGKGDGWVTIGSKFALNDGENSLGNYIWNGNDIFERWTGDPQRSTKRLGIRNPRVYKIDSTTLSYLGLCSMLTYHGISYNVSGTLVNYSGSAANIPVKLFSSSSHELLLNLTASANGNFTGTWFDSVDQVYLTARQTAALMGRSDNGTPWR